MTEPCQMHSAPGIQLDKLAYSIPNFAIATDLSRSLIYRAIAANELVPVYAAKRKPVISREEGLRWLRSLPAEPPVEE